MRGIRMMLAALAIGSLAAALPLQAQGWKQVEFSLGGGLGVPVGDFDDAFKLGWHGLAGVSYILPDAPFAFHVDGAFSRFNDEAAALNLKDDIIYGTGNVMYRIKVSETASNLPYLIAGGGGGVYNIDPRGGWGRTRFSH